MRDEHDSNVNRRNFLGMAGVTAGAGLATAIGASPGTAAASSSTTTGVNPGREYARRQEGYRLRLASADRAYADPYPAQRPNGEQTIPGYVASYHKGLPHNAYGEVSVAAYEQFIRAMSTGSQADYNAIPTGVQPNRGLLNPQVIHAFDLQGPDSHSFAVPPAPRLDSAEFAGEMVEDYWMALLRDVPFAQYGGSAEVATACDELSAMSGFTGPRQNGRITPATLFRAYTPGDLRGPYISQFLFKDVPYGPQYISQRLDTIEPREYMTDWNEWLAVQNGAPRSTERDFQNRRYIRTARDLGHFTHFDVTYTPYLNAALILFGSGLPAAQLLDPANPYLGSRNQAGYSTYGQPHVLALLGEVDKIVRKGNLYQQWWVHRRLRPEMAAARVEIQLNRAPGRYDGLLSDELLNAPVLDRVRSRYGSYLLPQMYPEGSPMSPDYVSGHSAAAAAGVTILKAWFNESTPLPDPVVPNADGTALVPYTGSDAGQLTIGGELNKLAGNIGNGRNTASVHWRSSYVHAFPLGEAIAIRLLRDQKRLFNERAPLSLTKFDGTTITI
ncbi:hypothetical protein [Allonocardiopsis opalescens]|uniref:Phosphoesterase n=1 Tax=Allonocardiopsis opalescens TaxID=1144618 RepID=A0A2T0QET8_9ACTN|nr:hypothetical protein [Allonocardiopsis opalescens]PRY02439.1 hypothetical protein CLV72_1011041 [Allonocardiopsis opalescens]